MTDKRKIDDARDAAISLRVGTEQDGVSVSEFYKLGPDRLFTIYGKAIYEVIFPDDVDPKRTNPNIRPVHQQILPYGLDDEFVSRILMTDKTLVGERKLPGFPEHRISLLAFECLKDLIAMREMRDDLAKVQQAVEKKFESETQTRESTRLPSIPDIEVRCEGITQRARHAVACINDIAVAFFGDELKKKSWLEVLIDLIVADQVVDEERANHWEKIRSFITFVVETRNAVEHRKDGYRFKICDYRLGVDNLISQPTVELVHPKLPLGPSPALAFVNSIIEGLLVVYEDVVAALCDLKLRHQKGAPMYVVEVPLDQRRYKFVRFGYAIELGGKTHFML